MLLEGRFTIEAPVARVWDALFDVPTMAGWVPGVTGARKIDDTRYEVTVEQQVAFLTARFDARLELLEVEPPRAVTFRLEGQDGRIASSMKVVSHLTLAETPDGWTDVTYRNDMSVFGRLGTIGFSIIKRKAREIEQEFARRANATLRARQEGA
jgi:carbon monoxide dehydrogenase subunit G